MSKGWWIPPFTQDFALLNLFINFMHQFPLAFWSKELNKVTLDSQNVWDQRPRRCSKSAAQQNKRKLHVYFDAFHISHLVGGKVTTSSVQALDAWNAKKNNENNEITKHPLIEFIHIKSCKITVHLSVVGLGQLQNLHINDYCRLTKNMGHPHPYKLPNIISHKIRVVTGLYLVGGFNPSEKYARQIGFIFPNFRGEN